MQTAAVKSSSITDLIKDLSEKYPLPAPWEWRVSSPYILLMNPSVPSMHHGWFGWVKYAHWVKCAHEDKWCLGSFVAHKWDQMPFSSQEEAIQYLWLQFIHRDAS